MNSFTIFRNLSKLDRCCSSAGFLAASQKLLTSGRCNNISTTGTLLSPTEFPPNSSITPIEVNNRNPRNLEKLRIGEKPSGWELEKESKSFWNKVTLDVTSRHITASVVHYLGYKPIIVSTKEWCIKKYLYSTNDASAAKLVGDVLARRCLQTGITELACFFPEGDRKKEKVHSFLSAMENGGVALSEPSQVPNDWNIHYWELPETPWEVHEDIDDKFSIASKLRGFHERKHKSPRFWDIKQNTIANIK